MTIDLEKYRNDLKKQFIYFPFIKSELYSSQEYYNDYVDRIIDTNDYIKIMDLAVNNELMKNTSDELMKEIYKITNYEQTK